MSWKSSCTHFRSSVRQWEPLMVRSEWNSRVEIQNLKRLARASPTSQPEAKTAQQKRF